MPLTNLPDVERHGKRRLKALRSSKRALERPFRAIEEPKWLKKIRPQPDTFWFHAGLRSERKTFSPRKFVFWSRWLGSRTHPELPKSVSGPKPSQKARNPSKNRAEHDRNHRKNGPKRARRASLEALAQSDQGIFGLRLVLVPGRDAEIPALFLMKMPVDRQVGTPRRLYLCFLRSNYLNKMPLQRSTLMYHVYATACINACI